MRVAFQTYLMELSLLSTVAAARLLTSVDAQGISASANNLVSHTGKVANTTTADQNNGVFLKVVPFAGDVDRNFLAVAQSNAGDFAKSRVGLLGGHGSNDQTYPLFLRATFENRALRAFALYDAVAADQLIDSWHTVAAKKSFERSVNTKGGSRTHTSLRTLDFESSASAIPPLWLHLDAICE